MTGRTWGHARKGGKVVGEGEGKEETRENGGRNDEEREYGIKNREREVMIFLYMTSS